MKTSQHRPDRLRLHGPDALQRVSAGAAVLRPAVSSRCSRRSARAMRIARRRSPTTGATSRSRPTGGSWSSGRTSTSSTSRARTTRTTRSRSPPRKAGKMVMCEKPLGAERRRGEGDGRRRSRRPACRTRSGTTTAACRPSRCQAAHRRRQARPHLPLPREVPAGLDDLRRTCRRAAKASGGSTSTVAGSGVTGDLLAHCIDTALWLNGPITEVTAMTETFIKERKHNLTGKVEPVGIDDASAFLCRFENGSLATFEVDALRPRPQGALHARDQRRARLGVLGPARPAPPAVLRSHATKASVRGWRSVHVTDGDHPYMKHWWVPGLQIGYEHTFIHQVADFLAGRRRRARAVGADVPRRPGDRLRHRRGAQVGEDAGSGSRSKRSSPARAGTRARDRA